MRSDLIQDIAANMNPQSSEVLTCYWCSSLGDRTCSHAAGEFPNGQSPFHHVMLFLESLFSKTGLSADSPFLLEFPIGYYDQVTNPQHDSRPPESGPAHFFIYPYCPLTSQNSDICSLYLEPFPVNKDGLGKEMMICFGHAAPRRQHHLKCP